MTAPATNASVAPPVARVSLTHTSVRATITSSLAAIASVSHTVVATVRRFIRFQDVRCPDCNRLVMAVPGEGTIVASTVADNASRTGKGPVVSCPRCHSLVEVVRTA